MQHPNRYYGIPEPGKNPVYVWGHVTTMLKDGGGWDGEPAPSPWQREHTDAGVRRRHRTKRRSVEVYPGEFVTEPDRKRSNHTWTGKLIQKMKKAGFSWLQVDAALSDPEHVGGEWFRWRCMTAGGRGLMREWYDNSDGPKTPLPLTTNSGGEVVSRGSGKAWRQANGFTYWRRQAMDLLAFVEVKPRTMSEIQTEGPVHHTVVRRYLDALKDAGLVRITDEEQFLCRDGKRRAARVARVAPPRAVDAALSGESLPEADRPLWETLPRLCAPQEPPERRPARFDLDDLLGGLEDLLTTPSPAPPCEAPTRPRIREKPKL